MALDGVDVVALPPWMKRGACVGARDPDVWFPEKGGSPEPARAICARCPVRDKCLVWALEHEDYGIWGGTTEKERRAIKRRTADAA